MAAPPMPYRANQGNGQPHVASFPPPIYYRDTFGLQPVTDRRHLTDSECSDSSSMATKSTVKTTMNIFHPVANHNNPYTMNSRMGLGMQDSQYTDGTQQSSHFQVEQIITNQILIMHARILLILTLIALGSAIQLLVFSIICLFFDGAPYYVCLISSLCFIFNSSVLLYFIRRQHSRLMLLICLAGTAVCVIICIFLFFWTAYLISTEDEQIRRDSVALASGTIIYKQSSQISGDNDKSKPIVPPKLATNPIIRDTRMAMYSLHMVLALVQATCCGAILYILYRNQISNADGKISKGYFFCHPTKHQTVLVPITLKQVRGKLTRRDDDDDVENTSIGVQTSGGGVGSRSGDLV
ncbi:hypothetical protein DdX_03902 [Ditylenchus destructor]|uniref:Uncharacterized protein n=1 Tax=Ditylenchus destructor TaxID=166010 RepID=A0AAD4RBE2_9BILA|nr:hypothetical protein DdX_03902 [Ditylenchus destructor]